MRQRAATATIFVIAMLIGVFGGAKTFYLLFACITAGCLWELMGLLFAQEERYILFRQICGTALGAMPFLIFGAKVFKLFRPVPTDARFNPYFFAADLSDNISPILLSLILLLLLVFLLMIVELFLDSDHPFSNIGNYLLGAVYIGIPFALLISLSYWHGNYAPLRVFGLLFLNWTNDTMAYVIGSKIGKTPFFKRISPKKTWEGTLGGVVCTFIVAFTFSWFIHDFDPAEWLLLAGVISVFGSLGDLVESMLKRSIQIKDSGSLLPGHGGFLDRFDAFIFILPFAWLAMMIMEG